MKSDKGGNDPVPFNATVSALLRIGRFVGYALLVILALVTLGGLAPVIPVLGSIGPLLITPFGPWIVIFSLLGAIVTLRRWRSSSSKRALLMTAFALLTAIGATYILVQQIAVARVHGVDIDLVQMLLPEPAASVAPPVIETYGTYSGEALTLAIYHRVAVIDQNPAPVIVYVHGGGWGGGTLHDRAADMHWFASHGYLVFSVEYALSSAERSTWNLAQPQIGCALIWIADNARRMGGDPSRLVLFGESAGGNLVLNTSYLINAGSLKPSCPGVPPRIAATVAAYPIVDAVRMYQNEDVLAGPFARQMTTNYTGGTLEQYPDRYRAISSASHINPAAPPTLLMPGLADHLLPPEPVYAFATKARSEGVDARVVAFPYGEHSFDQRVGSAGSQLFRGVTLRFLQEHNLAP